MPNVNTNHASTPPATLRAQLVTEAVIAAYIQEISNGHSVVGASIRDPLARRGGWWTML